MSKPKLPGSDIINGVHEAGKKAEKEKKAAARKPFTSKLHEIVEFGKVVTGMLTSLVFLSHAAYAIMQLTKTNHELWRGAFAVWAASSIVVGFVILWRSVMRREK